MIVDRNMDEAIYCIVYIMSNGLEEKNARSSLENKTENFSFFFFHRRVTLPACLAVAPCTGETISRRRSYACWLTMRFSDLITSFSGNLAERENNDER